MMNVCDIRNIICHSDDGLSQIKKIFTLDNGLFNKDLFVQTSNIHGPLTNSAIKYGKFDILKYFIEDGKVDINYRVKFHSGDGDNSMLHYAILYEKNDIANYLLNKNIEVNFMNNAGYTALSYAKYCNQIMISRLTELGAIECKSAL